MTENNDRVRAAQAACGAYLLVAFADARFVPSEEARFLSVLANENAFADCPADSLETEYNRLTGALRRDYASAAEDILLQIAAIADDETAMRTVVMAASAAIVADNRLEAQENAALGQIENALGLDKGYL